MPMLGADEVRRFVALGERGRARLRGGDEAGAERAFRGQNAIFPGNSEPYVSLALLEAGRGNKKPAMDYLHQAVARGLTDLKRIERTEAWVLMRGNREFNRLRGTIADLVQLEARWPDWDSVRIIKAPRSAEEAFGQHERGLARVAAMAPALGPHLTRRWEKLIDRVTAAVLESYLGTHPAAEDAGPAIERLMELYAEGPLRQWQRMPSDAARRLGTLSRTVLENYPDSTMRAHALVGAALARNVERNASGVLSAAAAGSIREHLDEVLTRFPDSKVAATAAVGSIRAAWDAGLVELAQAGYRRLQSEHRDRPGFRATVQQQLGEVALRVGGVPDFEAPGLDGRTLGRDALDGKVAVLDFWATWCAPCVEGLPTLRKIEKRHGEDVVVLGVNLDSADDFDLDQLRQWVAEQDVPGRQLHDGLGWESDLVKSFGVLEIPFSVVVAADGSVVAVNEHGKGLEKAVNQAVRRR